MNLIHRASPSPGYGTQPLHRHQTQNRPKRWKRCLKARTTVPKRGDFGSTIRTRRESQCLSYLNFISTTVFKQPPRCLASPPAAPRLCYPHPQGSWSTFVTWGRVRGMRMWRWRRWSSRGGEVREKGRIGEKGGIGEEEESADGRLT